MKTDAGRWGGTGLFLSPVPVSPHLCVVAPAPD